MKAGYPVHQQCRDAGIPEPIAELQFHPTRRWRADYAWPAQKVILEVEGGVWIGGRHSGGIGQIKDFEKYNAAALLGYRVLRYTPAQIKSGEYLESLKSILL